MAEPLHSHWQLLGVGLSCTRPGTLALPVLTKCSPRHDQSGLTCACHWFGHSRVRWDHWLGSSCLLWQLMEMVSW